jgi:hypothetical protein
MEQRAPKIEGIEQINGLTVDRNVKGCGRADSALKRDSDCVFHLDNLRMIFSTVEMSIIASATRATMTITGSKARTTVMESITYLPCEQARDSRIRKA